MKRLLLAMLLSLSFAAHAADVTLTITVDSTEYTAFAAAVGEEYGLFVTQTPQEIAAGTPKVPRSATPAEVKKFFIDKGMQLMADRPDAKRRRAAADAVVPTPFTPK